MSIIPENAFNKVESHFKPMVVFIFPLSRSGPRFASPLENSIESLVSQKETKNG